MFTKLIHRALLAGGVLAATFTPAAQADDVSGADRILCASRPRAAW